MPLVSVIVRSMARPTLSEALASIALQDYPQIEVLVIAANGAAHPAPPPFAGSHPLRFIAGEHVRPRPVAANAGLDAARGEWITFLDDDDLFLAGHISGLVGAASAAGNKRLVHSLARARFAGGGPRLFGHPFSLIELYERNYIHLSTALVPRELLTRGCRFDETLEIHEDWDFFLQCAQHGPFHFSPLQSVEWRADLGASGAGAGANQDDARFADFRDRVYAKWSAQRDALIDRVETGLREAAAKAARGEHAAAETQTRALLRVSPNDPWALNLIAMIERATGRLAAAEKTQTLAVAVRPEDASLIFNLGVISRARGDSARARTCVERALVLAPGYGPAQKLLAELDAGR